MSDAARMAPAPCPCPCRLRGRGARATLALLLILVATHAAGCLANRPLPPGERATDVPPTEAQPQFWLEQPPAAVVEYPTFEPLWDACEQVARRHLFTIDRLDRRSGLMTTHPLVSRQFFEIWRNDTATVADAAQSSLGTIRRTLRFELERVEDGTYIAVPKVLVERYIAPERRYTTTLQYAGAFMQPPTPAPVRRPGTAEPAPTDYWYVLGRDRALEQRLADAIERQLR
jgi:hypothetical protein